jgi:hypothetical protein
MTLSEDDRRALARWAADCAERVLPLFESVAPGDPRPRGAIEAARAFGRGQLRIGPARAAAAAAHRAARAVVDPAARNAARAAGHASATAHMAAHARGAPAYASIAAGLAATDPADAARRELTSAIEGADPDVRRALLRLPDPLKGGGALGAAIRDLEAGISRGHGESGA